MKNFMTSIFSTHTRYFVKRYTLRSSNGVSTGIIAAITSEKKLLLHYYA